ncbi:MAG TPA: AI-2E family transporter [Leptolyngbyaceae cyanobacterium]
MEIRSIVRPLVGGASLIIIIAGLRAASGLLGPILMALFIVLAVSPLVDWLRRKRVPAWLAHTLVVVGVVLLGLSLIVFLALSVTQFSAALPDYRTQLEAQVRGLAAWLDSRGVQAEDVLRLNLVSPGRIFSLVISFISGLLGTLSNAGLTLFIFIYMLLGASSFGRKLNRGLGQRNPVLTRLESFSRSISVYILIKTWLGLLTAIGQTLLLLLLGIDFALLWGVLSFLFNYIPSIGYIIALVPPVLMALLQFGVVKALIVFLGYAIINNLFDVVIGPKYLGKGLDLSTLVTFLAVILWAWILGPIGAFLALPLTVMLKKVFLETYEDSRILATLMGSDDRDVM